MADNTIHNLQVELTEATERYMRLYAAEQSASKDCTAALNSLNQAQKRFDEAVAALKKVAPYRSDWADRKESAR